jgi:hypothetical protein
MTKRQQDIFSEKSKFNKRSWNYEAEEALDFLNMKPTAPNKMGRAIR